jgi:excisionase family DNA binding protein
VAKRSINRAPSGAIESAPDDRARSSLHRDRVVETAIAILDTGGPQALTFRRLAAELDVGVATLYWHVENKDALLQLSLDHVIGEMRTSFAADSERPWDERLHEALVDLWNVLRRHPWAAGLAMASADRGPNLLRHWDREAALLFSAGFDESEVFYGLSALFTHVIGSAAQVANWHSYDVDSDALRREMVAQAAAFFDSLDPHEFPSAQRVAPVLAAHDEDEQLSKSIDLIIAGMRATLAARRPDRATTEDVLTVDELAELLRVPADVVTARAERGELPGRRFGDDWRFMRGAVLAWLAGGTDDDQNAE